MSDAVTARPSIQVNVPAQGFEIKVQEQNSLKNGSALGTIIFSSVGLSFRRPNVGIKKEPRSGITWEQLRRLADVEALKIKAFVDLVTTK